MVVMLSIVSDIGKIGWRAGRAGGSVFVRDYES